MTRFIIRRLLLTIPVLIGASLLIYAMVYALPGDPVRALAGDRPLSPAVQAQIRADYNLDDPFAGFERLLTYLAPGGQILLYLYSRPPTRNLRSIGQSCSAALRTVTTRISHPALKKLSSPVAAVLYGGIVAPGAWGEKHGVAPLAGLPMDAYRGKPFRSLVLDTFDRLSAPVEHRYVWSDLEPWFDRTGLVVDAARDETGWFLLAHRP